MDISLERYSVDIGKRGLQSINRARAFLNQELLKGKTVCLRRAWAGKEGEEEDEEDEAREELGVDTASGAASTALLQDIESARELFFVVEEKSQVGEDAATRPGAATSENVKGEAAGTSSSPSSLRIGGEDGRRDYGGGGCGLRHDSGNRYDGGGPPRAAAEGGDYSVPYWAILRVGELTNDPGVTPEPWPLFGVSNGRAAGGQQQLMGLALPRSQMPPPSQVHRPPNVPDSVGYRIVYINVKVSIHHPRGSSVGANKDAVIDGVTRVRGRERGKGVHEEAERSAACM